MVPARDKFAVWSPHRDSNSVVSFKAVLGMRAERWVWHDEPQRATWWLVDGLRDPNNSLTVALVDARLTAPIHGALLAPDWSAVRDPTWAFFKVPLLAKSVYSWVDSCLLLHPASPAWEGCELKLRRWPNMSRYGADTDTGTAVLLTAACAQLLKEFTSYENLLRTVPHKSKIDLLLADALHDGILDIAKREEPADTINSNSNSQLPPVNDSRMWALVKRLITKFS